MRCSTWAWVAALGVVLGGCVVVERSEVATPDFGAARDGAVGGDAEGGDGAVFDLDGPVEDAVGGAGGQAVDEGVDLDDGPAADQEAGADSGGHAPDSGPQCERCAPGDSRPCGFPQGVCFVAEQICVAGCWAACPGLAAQGVETCDGQDEDCDGRVDEGLGVGEVCAQGIGACAAEGVFRCGAEGLVCDASPGVPREEICNGLDDDCDGIIDEALGCPECLDVEVCNGLDDDCDGAVDEGVANACGGCGPVPPERCDGLDNDCDGQVDEGLLNACGGCGPLPQERCNGRDDDCDGVIDEGVANRCGACGPEPAEICNGLDDDCDGSVDEGVLNACGRCGEVPVEVCNGADDDCDGAVDEAVTNACGRCGPVPAEICNGFDDDCDGRVDEGGACAGVAEVCDGVDQDGDGRVDEGLVRPCGLAVGRCAPGTETCVAGAWGACEGAVGPRAETCNGLDDDCDGRIDEELVRPCGSNQGRCVQGAQTCRAGDWGSCEGAVEPRAERCDGVDDDCDGRVDEGVLNACGACGPVPAEICDGVDNDCDGRVDEGVLNACGACGAVPVEVCDGFDNDCDGRVDEGLTNACGGCGAVPVERCDGLDNDCDGRIDEGVTNACGGCGPVPAEQCNNLDDDCDGRVDEGLIQLCGNNVGACRVGEQTCQAGVWGACEGGIRPRAELCNGEDDDCDGRVDELGPRPCTVGEGPSLECVSFGTETCENGRWLCDAPPVFGEPERCDGLDNDCDGRIDEGFDFRCEIP